VSRGGDTALGSVASGLFASVDLLLPVLTADVSVVGVFGVALTFAEAQVMATPVVATPDTPTHVACVASA
jgi:hypothetical protein